MSRVFGLRHDKVEEGIPSLGDCMHCTDARCIAREAYHSKHNIKWKLHTYTNSMRSAKSH